MLLKPYKRSPLALNWNRPDGPRDIALGSTNAQGTIVLEGVDTESRSIYALEA